MIQKLRLVTIQIEYALQEYACTALDVIARRTRIAFINVHAAEHALPKIIRLMSKKLKWSKEEEQAQHDHAMRFLRNEMGLGLKQERLKADISFTRDEYNKFADRFRALDHDHKGYITINDLRKYFEVGVR